MNFSFLKEKGSKYIIWILLGVLVLIMAIPVGKEEDSKSGTTSSDTAIQGEMELQLKKVLTSMEGVGEVEVMITSKSKKTDLFSDEYEDGEVLGVVVVAQGAGNPTIDAKILDAVKALFGIEAHKISIVKMRSQEV